MGPELRVNTFAASDQTEPVVTALTNGRFVVAWTDDSHALGDGSGRAVHAQIFHADGSRSGAEFLVNTTVGGSQQQPAVLALPDGGFKVIWEHRDGSDWDLYAQVFNADGSRSGGEVLVNTTTSGHQFDPEGTTLSDGRSVIIWKSSLDPGGQVLHGQVGPSLTTLADGRVVAAWTDASKSVDDPSGLAVRAQIFDPRETGINFTGTPRDDERVGTGFDDTLKGSGGSDRLHGAAGDELLIGGLGDDALDGGAGDDTAGFAHNFNDCTVMDFGAKIVVVGPDGVDTLTAIKHLAFADTTITPVDDGDPLFDTLYYLSRNPDVFQSGMNTRDHYDAFGRHEGRDPNAFFDSSGYLAVNKDVAAAGVNPLEHYRHSGWHEGLGPGARFDTTLYRLHNPDVAAAGVDPLTHYLQVGFAEGRAVWDAIGSNIVSGFDAQYYLLHNPDVAAAGADPLTHFNSFGWHEGRNPNGWFDTAGYLAHYADVAAAGVNPLEHYMMYGWQEGRDPSASFDTLGYLAANPDVAAAGINPLDHFLTFGIYEGRQAVNDVMWN